MASNYPEWSLNECKDFANKMLDIGLSYSSVHYLLNYLCNKLEENRDKNCDSEFYSTLESTHKECLKDLEIKLEIVKTSKPGNDSLRAMSELYEYMIIITKKLIVLLN